MEPNTKEEDKAVLKALLRRCLGYTATDKVYTFDKETGLYELTGKRERHIPPDVQACIFWLCNRMPDKWKKLKESESND